MSNSSESSPKNAVYATIPEEEENYVYVVNEDDIKFDESPNSDNSDASASTPPTPDAPGDAPGADAEGNDSKDNGKSSVMAGAAAVGGVIGLIIFGPFVAILAATGCAYASTKEGPSGDVARSAGSLGIATSNKAKELNEKHSIVDITKSAAGNAFDKSKKYNEKHGVTKKVGKSMVKGMDYLNTKISGREIRTGDM